MRPAFPISEASHSSVSAIPNVGQEDTKREIARTGMLQSFWREIWNLAVTAGDMLPAFGAGSTMRRLAFVEVGSGDFDVYRVTRGIPEKLGKLNAEVTDPASMYKTLEFKTIELRIDNEKIIHHKLQLPAESLDFLQPIIDHRLERLTPWKRENVTYGFTILPGKKDQEIVEVKFVATSRTLVNSSLERLSRFGITPTSVGSASDVLEQPVTIDLLQYMGGVRRPRRRIFDYVFLVLPVLAFSIYFTSLYATIESQSSLDAATNALDAQRRAANTGSADASLREQVRVMMDSKQEGDATFVFLNRLAELIPNTTFLTDLEIRKSSVRIKGRSANAPALIPLLEADPQLDQVRFESPVARDTDGGDRFDLIANFGPAPRAAQP